MRPVTVGHIDEPAPYTGEVYTDDWVLRECRCGTLLLYLLDENGEMIPGAVTQKIPGKMPPVREEAE